jgi:hypothetical protein
MKRHRFAFAFVAAVVLVLFAAPLLRREVFTFRDHADYFQPLRYFTQVHIRSFVLPYWNPYSASGEPWLANPQTGVCYPPTWLFIALPFETAYMLYLALHLMILGWGAYLLFARTASESAALVGAVALMLAGPTLSLLDISNNLATFVWLPLVIWCALERAPLFVAAPAIALSFLGGEPFFAAMGALAYAILAVLKARRLPSTLHVVLVAVSAFGLSAIQLFPFLLEYVRGSDRDAGLSRAQIFAESMPPRDWLRVAVPPRLSAAGYDAALSQHFIPVVYVGIPVAVLALAGVILRFRSREVAGWLTALVLTMIVAAGVGVFAWLPVTPFRYPSRVVPVGALALVALAVLGWDRLRPRRRWADLLLIGVIILDLVPRLQPLLAAAPFRTDLVPYGAQVGRGAKIIRLSERPPAQRAAWIAGYLNLYQRRFDAYTAAPLATAKYMRLYNSALTPGRVDLLNRIAVGFVLSDRPVRALEPIGAARGVTVYLNRNASPMATFWTRVESSAAAADAPAPFWTLRVAEPIDPRFATAQPSISSPSFLSLDTRHARVVVDAPADGVLLLTQQDSPGWRVFVDGAEARKLTAYGVFRAVEVPRGRHEVVWRYRPLSFWAGAAVTIVTLIALSLQLASFVKSREKIFLMTSAKSE